jgi:hypothetical protein
MLTPKLGGGGMTAAMLEEIRRSALPYLTPAERQICGVLLLRVDDVFVTQGRGTIWIVDMREQDADLDMVDIVGKTVVFQWGRNARPTSNPYTGKLYRVTSVERIQKLMHPPIPSYNVGLGVVEL